METSTIILPEHIKQLADPIDAALEGHLLKAMVEPGIEMTEADWKLRGERLAAKDDGVVP